MRFQDNNKTVINADIIRASMYDEKPPFIIEVEYEKAGHILKINMEYDKRVNLEEDMKSINNINTA